MFAAKVILGLIDIVVVPLPVTCAEATEMVSAVVSSAVFLIYKLPVRISIASLNRIVKLVVVDIAVAPSAGV